MNALIRQMIFWMARLACADCRKDYAKWLKKFVPTMLKEANEAAASFAEFQDQPPSGLH